MPAPRSGLVALLGDGTRLAFIAEGEPAGRQIFVRWMDAEGATSQVTRIEQSPANLRWSPHSANIKRRAYAIRKRMGQINSLYSCL